MASQTVYIKKGDLYPQLSATLQTEDGTAIDLTGATVVFRMSNQFGQNLVNTSATVVTAASGKVRYDWASGDTDVAGKFQGEFVATLASSRVVTCPNFEFIDIRVLDGVPTS